MMQTTHNEIHCKQSNKGRICTFLDEQGVPINENWRSFILFLNILKYHNYLTQKQKKGINTLLADILAKGDYTDKQFQDRIEQFRNIYSATYINKLQETIKESEKLLQEFKKLSKKRTGNVEVLQNTTVNCISGSENPRDIIKEVRSAFTNVIEEMNRDTEKLNQLSKTDQLTRLGNRRAFDEFLNASIQKYNSSFPVSLIMLDIDFFKKFNDNYGHRIGDQALSTVGKLCKYCVDKFSENLDEPLLPTRYGGEEFAVIMPGLTLEQAVKVADFIRKTLEDYDFIIRNNKGEISHKNITITASIGVAEVLPHWQKNQANQLVEAADKALYGAKERGRNQVCSYSVKLDKGQETVIII